MDQKIGLLIIGDEVLSGKRQDKHLSQANTLLRPRGLELAWVKIVGDEPGFLVDTLQASFESGDIVFSFGGIGATPDDRTRQAAAKALGLPIERHPEGVKEIEAQFGEDAYPQRIRMAEYPKGATIIPNFYNRVPGFSIRHHHFMPGFPMMAKPMMEWVLNQYYPHLKLEPKVEKTIRLIDGHESEWVTFMEAFEIEFPTLRLFSLPSISEQGDRTIELGVEGYEADAQKGLDALICEANKREASFELI
ncbi:Nicotinamide-nucleotide amidohydrolase PncC [Hydrogenovibrio crunogenus]|uniref:Nicotinamide-nucleotide amidohydrolase PncC n=1 Tax=Hydrogenovibrio crunogenus TaxID=39765 RepID=A0A4P7NYW1_9GAMM|nr:competence/damage-inducible protein A [Hydrogenovibrio crunogenus]QBZ82102.1 Nicotinamide-nucleotide amidohydrolase PncC [Hydrogenovibrio crunogenus]